ncbi:hypothetical protein [Aneurinibacillus tyrosinisolvens]|uniref:hypothetical protein n=1 Tax=Aneurinibacillus tyrosinisolvens TaxID=1443435 RepID=UPI00063F0D1A|nr:hypothetical protein [Aneurinibacillus tyrosinisolvens]
MNKNPNYTIRFKPSQDRPPEQPVRQEKQKLPKVTLNTAPVSLLPPQPEEEIPLLEEPAFEAVSARRAIGRWGTKRKRWTGSPPRLPKNMIHASIVVGGAIAVGLLFGYVALRIFSTNDAEHLPGSGKPNMASAVQENKQSSISGNKTEVTKPQAGTLPQQATPSPARTKQVTVSFPALPLHMVQGGVFTTKAGAEEIKGTIEQKGWPVYLSEEDGKYVLFLGSAVSRDDALAISVVYKEGKQDVYIKEKSLPGGTFTLNGPDTMDEAAAAEAAKYGQTETDLYGELSMLSATGLKAGKLEAGQQAQMEKLHRSLLQQMRSLGLLLTDGQKRLLQKEVNELTTAVTALQQFAKQPEQAYLWQAEESMLRFGFTHRELQQLLSR